jgi:hypothetical protein
MGILRILHLELTRNSVACTGDRRARFKLAAPSVSNPYMYLVAAADQWAR